MIRLPLPSHPARAIIDESINEIVEICDPKNRSRWVMFNDARYSAARTFKSDPAIKSVQSVCLWANDELWLVRFGPRGGYKKIWNFGKQ